MSASEQREALPPGSAPDAGASATGRMPGIDTAVNGSPKGPREYSGPSPLSGRHGGLLPRSGPIRSLLKRMYYSWTFRRIAYWPGDLLDRARGDRDPLVPPRRLQYVGHGGDYATIGDQWRERLLRDHGLSAETDVLDIGCGVGRIAAALVPVLDAGRYEGFDVVPPGIRWCRSEISSRHPHFRFQLADVRNRQYNAGGEVLASAYEFPYPDASFDLALASSVFTHMRPDGIRRYIDEAGRVLRPGGRLVAEFFLLDDVAASQLERGLTAFALDHRFRDPSGVEFLGSDPRVPEYNVAIAEGDVREMVAAAGLEVESIEFGRWSGRPGPPDARFQEFVTIVKPH